MTSFTKEQVEFIKWLSDGNYIDVCIEICPDIAKMTGYESYNGNFQRRSLFRLKMQGLLTEQARYEAGVHWKRCMLNKRGKEWLLHKGEQSYKDNSHA